MDGLTLLRHATHYLEQRIHEDEGEETQASRNQGLEAEDVVSGAAEEVQSAEWEVETASTGMVEAAANLMEAATAFKAEAAAAVEAKSAAAIEVEAADVEVWCFSAVCRCSYDSCAALHSLVSRR